MKTVVARASTDDGTAVSAEQPGVPIVPLAEVCLPHTGVRNPSAVPDVAFRYVDISAVDNVSKRITAAQSLLGKKAPSRARNVIRMGDVLVATTRPNLNAVAIVPPELDDQICSTGFSVLRAGPRLRSDYLFHFVQSPAFVKPLSDLVKGALYPAVSDAQVLAQRIPLPPLAEQERIAGRLTEQLAAVERAHAAAEARLAAAQALPAAYLREVFEGPEASGWKTVRLGSLLHRYNEIIHPGDRKSGEAVFVGLEHIESHTGRRLGSLTIDLGRMTGRKPKFRQGQIVYGYLRPYLNKVWLAEFDGCSSVDQFAFDVNPEVADATFVAAFMRSETFLRRSRVVTTTGQLPRIGIEEIAAVPIELPPTLADQRRIAADLSARLAGAERVIEAARAELAAIEAFPAALLREAFGGSDVNPANSEAVE